MRDQSKIPVVSHIAIAVCAVLYILVGVFGYLAFLSGTCQDILTNFSGSVIAIDIIRGGLGIGLACTYPVLLYEARHLLEE